MREDLAAALVYVEAVEAAVDVHLDFHGPYRPGYVETLLRARWALHQGEAATAVSLAEAVEDEHARRHGG
jgi:hypothetical protein